MTWVQFQLSCSWSKPASNISEPFFILLRQWTQLILLKHPEIKRTPQTQGSFTLYCAQSEGSHKQTTRTVTGTGTEHQSEPEPDLGGPICQLEQDVFIFCRKFAWVGKGTLMECPKWRGFSRWGAWLVHWLDFLVTPTCPACCRSPRKMHSFRRVMP